MECTPIDTPFGIYVETDGDIPRKCTVVAEMGVSPPTQKEDFLTECTPYPGGSWVVNWCEEHKKYFVTADDEHRGMPVKIVWGCGTQMSFTATLPLRV